MKYNKKLDKNVLSREINDNIKYSKTTSGNTVFGGYRLANKLICYGIIINKSRKYPDGELIYTVRNIETNLIDSVCESDII